MYDGTIASGATVMKSIVIARYFFKEGTGATAFDTSGVAPAADLSLSGSVTFSGGWGINIASGGSARVMGSGNDKLSIASPRAPVNSPSKAGSHPATSHRQCVHRQRRQRYDNAGNFALVQKAYQYQSAGSQQQHRQYGEPALLTKDTDRDAQVFTATCGADL